MILTHDGDSYECFAEFWEDLMEQEDVIDGEMKVGNSSSSGFNRLGPSRTI